MARILAISSQVVFGPVGLTAIVPALQAQGHEVLALPTVILSNHPGHGPPAGVATPVAEMVAALERIGALENLDAVLTGYFANPGQVSAVAKLISHLKVNTILVDPVLGDDGRLYVDEAVAAALRDELLPLATIATPNVFELHWLTGNAVGNLSAAVAAARLLPAEEVIATSVPDGDDLATLRITADGVQHIKTRRRTIVPHGTGDFLSGLYLAHLLKADPPSAFTTAMAQLEAAIAASEGTSVLQVI